VLCRPDKQSTVIGSFTGLDILVANGNSSKRCSQGLAGATSASGRATRQAPLVSSHLLPQDIHSLRQNTGTTTFAPATTENQTGTCVSERTDAATRVPLCDRPRVEPGWARHLCTLGASRVCCEMPCSCLPAEVLNRFAPTHCSKVGKYICALTGYSYRRVGLIVAFRRNSRRMKT
jgi:hypothetical protein